MVHERLRSWYATERFGARRRSQVKRQAHVVEETTPAVFGHVSETGVMEATDAAARRTAIHMLAISITHHMFICVIVAHTALQRSYTQRRAKGIEQIYVSWASYPDWCSERGVPPHGCLALSSSLTAAFTTVRLHLSFLQ
jgi:hypothetical protein